MPSSRLSLEIAARAGRSHVPYLQRHVRAAHGILKSRVIKLSLALVGDAEMSGLHEEFMGVSGPTDVLTFPIDEDSNGKIVSGEIVICVPQARRQAKQVGTSVRRELLLYAIHGLLHLGGFDDRTPAGFATMHRKEDEILTRLGVGPVFHPAPDRRAKKNPDGEG